MPLLAIFVSILALLATALAVALRRASRTIAHLQTHLTEAEGKHKQTKLLLSHRAEVEAIKDELIGNVSHELRTPLTSIRGALGLLSAGLSGALDPKGQHLLRIALTNTDRLIRLVTDILDLERMESGQANLQLRRCSFTSLIQQAIDTISPTAEAAHITLAFAVVELPAPVPAPASAPIPLPGLPTLTHPAPLHLPSPTQDRRAPRKVAPAAPEPAFFDADPDRITQVLTNLLANAIKFSPPDTTVAVHLAASPGVLHLRIQDQGRGIPEDKLETIFDRFQQVEQTDARQQGGTGLGLAICRTIVQQHGGTIWAERNPTVGVTLCVDLPRIQRFADQPHQPSDLTPPQSIPSPERQSPALVKR